MDDVVDIDPEVGGQRLEGGHRVLGEACGDALPEAATRVEGLGIHGRNRAVPARHVQAGVVVR
jgi:hypothetical protein